MKKILLLLTLSLFVISCKKEVEPGTNSNPIPIVENWSVLVNGVSPFDASIVPSMTIEIKENHFIFVASGAKMQGNTINFPLMHCDIFNIFELNAQNYTVSSDTEIGFIENFGGGHGYSNTQNGFVLVQ